MKSIYDRMSMDEKENRLKENMIKYRETFKKVESMGADLKILGIDIKLVLEKLGLTHYTFQHLDKNIVANILPNRRAIGWDIRGIETYLGDELYQKIIVPIIEPQIDEIRLKNALWKYEMNIEPLLQFREYKNFRPKLVVKEEIALV